MIGFPRRGALAAMPTGFVCVPLLKFVVPAWHLVFDALESLVSAFAASMLAAVLASLRDHRTC